MTGANVPRFEVLPWEITGNCVALKYRSTLGEFTESVEFPLEVVLNDKRRRLFDVLALVSAVSYAKTLAPIHVSAPGYELTEETAQMVNALYDHGMREFAVHNSLPLHNTFVLSEHVDAPATYVAATSIEKNSSLLIPLGGGRDSSVVATALQEMTPTLLSIGENRYAQQIAQQLSLPLQTIKRAIDPHLLALNANGALNGHIPVTAINSIISLVYADMMQCVGVVMANEASSSEPTRILHSEKINHQYSKSYQFESLLRSALSSMGIDTQYFSALRDRDDAAIARTFALRCTDLHTSFMSCNKAMLRDESRRSRGWCGQCPKCRSVFLSLAPFLTPEQLTKIFGSNLLNTPENISGFHELLDISTKPFECVGEIATAVESFQKLRTSPLWKNCTVVKGLADALIPTPQFTTKIDHFIPAFIHNLMNVLFEQ